MHVQFWPTLFGLELLVLFQAILANRDDYLIQGQRWTKPLAYTLDEHGGWWTDMLVISPVFAFVASQNEVSYLSWRSFFILVLSGVVWGGLTGYYQEQARTDPEAHTHDGKTTPAGWIHVLFAVMATWFAGLYFFGGFETLPAPGQRLAMFVACWAIVVIGGVKFSKRWKWSLSTTIQSIVVALALMAGELHVVGLM